MHDTVYHTLGEDRPGCGKPESCRKVGYEYADISIPVEVRPNAVVGPIETECCGEPSVVCAPDDCGEGCRIIITQRVRIKIPVKCGVETIPGYSYVTCAPDGAPPCTQPPCTQPPCGQPPCGQSPCGQPPCGQLPCGQLPCGQLR